MHALCESIGGSLISIGFCGDGTWGHISFVDVPTDGAFATVSAAGATGAFERVEYHELRSAEQMDALVAAQLNWRAPGS